MLGPNQAPTYLPSGSSTIRQPSPLVAVVPSVEGVEPTTIQPVFSMVMAVVRPTPPGHCASFCGSLARR